MNEIEDVLRKYNWPTRGLIDDLNFKEIENVIGFNLPNDYKQFLRKYSSYETHIGEEYLKLWGFNELLEYNSGYGIIDTLEMTIGIGSNGGGELIGLKNSDGKTKIILTPFIDLEKNNHIEIGDSFTDFIRRLDIGQSWFKETQR